MSNSSKRGSRKKCCRSNDVPYTNQKTGMVFWKQEPCNGERLPGSRFCLWHHDDEMKRADQAKQLADSIRAAQRANPELADQWRKELKGMGAVETCAMRSNARHEPRGEN